MSHNDEDKPDHDATHDDEAPDKAGQSADSDKDSESHDEPKDESQERDPAVAEIEDDPSLNPDNELLRDIKGG